MWGGGRACAGMRGGISSSPIILRVAAVTPVTAHRKHSQPTDPSRFSRFWGEFWDWGTIRQVNNLAGTLSFVCVYILGITSRHTFRRKAYSVRCTCRPGDAHAWGAAHSARNAPPQPSPRTAPCHRSSTASTSSSSWASWGWAASTTPAPGATSLQVCVLGGCWGPDQHTVHSARACLDHAQAPRWAPPGGPRPGPPTPPGCVQACHAVIPCPLPRLTGLLLWGVDLLQRSTQMSAPTAVQSVGMDSEHDILSLKLEHSQVGRLEGAGCWAWPVITRPRHALHGRQSSG